MDQEVVVTLFFLRQRCRDARPRSAAKCHERSALRIPCRSDVSLKYGHAMEMVDGCRWEEHDLGDLWLIGWWIFFGADCLNVF